MTVGEEKHLLQLAATFYDFGYNLQLTIVHGVTARSCCFIDETRPRFTRRNKLIRSRCFRLSAYTLAPVTLWCRKKRRGARKLKYVLLFFLPNLQC